MQAHACMWQAQAAAAAVVASSGCMRCAGAARPPRRQRSSRPALAGCCEGARGKQAPSYSGPCLSSRARMIRPILTRLVVALLVISNARADGGTSALAQSTQVTESPLVLLLQRKLEALEARLERTENSLLDTQSHAQRSDSRVDQLEFTVQRLLEQKNSNESTAAAPLLQPPPPPPPPPLLDYTRPIIADVRETGDERSVSGSLRSRKQSPGSTTCALGTLTAHLNDIAAVCCPGNDCTATTYPGANGTCSAQCAAVVEPFWESCSNFLGALNMIPTGFDQFYINCMITLYPPGHCGSQCTQSTYHCRMMEVNQACCSDPLNCPANLATPLQCPIGCALVFPAFVSDCGAAHILTNTEVSQFQHFVHGCLRADPAELVEYAQGLMDQNCTVNLPAVTGPPPQHLPPSVPMFQSDPWITNIHDSSTCMTFSEVRSRVSEAHRICCPGGVCRDARGEIAFPTSCTPECALAFHDLRHDCGFLLNFSLPVDTLEEWDQFDQLCLAQSTVDTAGFLVALHNASCCTAGQCSCETAQSCAAVAFDSVQGACWWNTSASSCQVQTCVGNINLMPCMPGQVQCVNVEDVLTALSSFQVNADGDTDGNGVTDTVDVLNVLAQYGDPRMVICLATTIGGSSALSPPPVALHFRTASPSPVVTVVSSDATTITVQLSLGLAATESSVFAIFASSQTAPMTFPPAMQFGTTGVDYGAPPVTISDGSYADNSRDSWLSVGATATAAVLSSVGINFGSWATAGLTVTDGAVLWTNPTNAPGSGAIVAQITTGCGTASSATINAQGAGVSGDDWQATSLVFSWTCV
jgi:hypothetical protein